MRHEVSDDDLLSPGRTRLSSARARFTVLFEMGRSGSTPLWSSDLTGCRPRGSGGSARLAQEEEVKLGELLVHPHRHCVVLTVIGSSCTGN